MADTNSYGGYGAGGVTAGYGSGGYVSPNTTPAMPQENPVAVSSASQAALEELRALPRTLMGGTEAMRSAGRAYAPQHPAESDGSYNTRISTTVLFGAFSQTVGKQAGKMFAKPVVLVDADPLMEEFANDVDGEGRSITAFLNDEAKEGFVDGISYLLVDFPTIAEGSTQADVNLLGARPYWVLVRACQVKGVKSQNIGGQQVPTQFRFVETVEEDIDEFTTQSIEQIRVLDIGGFYRVYRKVVDDDGDEDWRVVTEGRASWVEIPVIPIYVNRTGFFEGKPPLRELAELNAEHWASSSEQRRALSFLRFAMLALIGAVASKSNPVTVEIGPDKVINLPAGGDAKYIEHNGQGIKAGADDLSAIEQRMQSVGMEIRVENAGEVTATASAIDSAESNAALKAVAKGIEAAAQQAMRITGEFLRTTQVGTVKVYDEFAENVIGVPLDFVNLYNAGVLSRETTWDELVRRHFLDDDFDPKLEAERLAQESEQMAALQGSPLDLNGGQQPSQLQEQQLPGAA